MERLYMRVAGELESWRCGGTRIVRAKGREAYGARVSRVGSVYAALTTHDAPAALEDSMNEVVLNEDVRAARLVDAQAKAAELFAAIETRGIVAPGIREVEA